MGEARKDIFWSTPGLTEVFIALGFHQKGFYSRVRSTPLCVCGGGGVLCGGFWSLKRRKKGKGNSRQKPELRMKQEEQTFRVIFKCKIEKKIMLVTSLTYTPVTQSILFPIFLMYKNHRCLIYSGQESRKTICIFFILTDLWPWNKVKVIKLCINW